jgi:hypothetical protein
VDGGAAADDFLMQFQADMLGCRIERPACMETTALGAAALAALALGWQTPEASPPAPLARSFRPRDARRNPPKPPRPLAQGRRPRRALGRTRPVSIGGLFFDPIAPVSAKSVVTGNARQ